MNDLKKAIDLIINKPYSLDIKKDLLNDLKLQFIFKEDWEVIETAIDNLEVTKFSKYELSTTEILLNYKNYELSFLLDVLKGIDFQNDAEVNVIDKIFPLATSAMKYHLINAFARANTDYFFRYQGRIFNASQFSALENSHFAKIVNDFIKHNNLPLEVKDIFFDFVDFQYEELNLNFLLSKEHQIKVANLLVNSFSQGLLRNLKKK